MPIELGKDTSHYDKCRTLLNIHKTHHKTRVIIFSFLTLMNMYFAITLPITHNLSLIYGTALYGFLFGGFAVLYSIGIFALIWFAVPEKPKFLILAGLLIILGMTISIINLIIGIAMLIVCISQIPDCKQALWIQKQEGYPHFNERFDEQMRYYKQEYQADHFLDDVRDAEMIDIPEKSSPDFIVKPKDEMPEIPDISDNMKVNLTKKGF